MLAKTENKRNSNRNINDSPILDLNNSAIKSLIKKGKVNGFVTLDEFKLCFTTRRIFFRTD